MRSRTLIAVVLAALALAACGGSDDEDGGGEQPGGSAAKAAPDCVAMWNDRASADQRAKASLSHRGDAGEPVLVGRYAGEPFSASGDGFDAQGSTTSKEVAVANGDCVAVDLTSNDTETNWVMALAKGQDGSAAEWWFLPTDGDHPLADPPQPIDAQAQTIITGFGEEAKLVPKGP